MSQFEHQIIGRIVGSGDFLQDDVFLALELIDIENRIAHDVGDDIEGQRPIVAQTRE